MSKCRITVVKKDLYADLIARYCDPATVPCEVFEVGDEFLVDRESFFNLRFRKPFCSEAWNAISTYVFTMVQGGEPSWAVNHTILTCCNDGARPVVFKLERIDDRSLLTQKKGLSAKADSPFLVSSEITAGNSTAVPLRFLR